MAKSRQTAAEARKSGTIVRRRVPLELPVRRRFALGAPRHRRLGVDLGRGPNVGKGRLGLRRAAARELFARLFRLRRLHPRPRVPGFGAAEIAAEGRLWAQAQRRQAAEDSGRNGAQPKAEPERLDHVARWGGEQGPHPSISTRSTSPPAATAEIDRLAAAELGSRTVGSMDAVATSSTGHGQAARCAAGRRPHSARALRSGEAPHQRPHPPKPVPVSIGAPPGRTRPASRDSAP